MIPAVRDAYAEMMPRLRAEEELRAINAVAAASGTMRADSRARYLSTLEADARAESEPTKKATPAVLAGMSIRVREVPKRG